MELVNFVHLIPNNNLMAKLVPLLIANKGKNSKEMELVRTVHLFKSQLKMEKIVN